MSAYNRRFEIPTIVGQPMAGVLGVTVGGITLLLAYVFREFDAIAVLFFLVSIGAFVISVISFRLGHDIPFLWVIVRYWWYRRLTTLEHRDH